MTGSPLISVVIPVYNVERYLRQCLDSVLAQTYQNLDIIVVDDGSTDKSSEICDEYARLHSNITVIHQSNAGQSSARNTGLLAARGEYIGFVDSDDYVSPIFFEMLYSAISQTNCLMATVRHGVSFFEGENPPLDVSPTEASAFCLIDEVDYQRELLYQKSWNGAVWRMCHKSITHKVKFPVGDYYEDAATAYKFSHGCKTVAVLESTSLYAYRQNPVGIMRGAFSVDKANSCIRVTREMYQNITHWYPMLEKAACSRCFAINRVVFSQAAGFPHERDLLWNELLDYRNTVLKDVDARKRERAAAIVALFGKRAFSLFCWLYRRLLHSQ